jgi:hypothetical protein
VGASVAILDFGGPVSPEPLKLEHSYHTETCTLHAQVWRLNLPVISTSGSELFKVKVFAPKFSWQATAQCKVTPGLAFLENMRLGTEHLSHKKNSVKRFRKRRNGGFSVPCILDLAIYLPIFDDEPPMQTGLTVRDSGNSTTLSVLKPMSASRCVIKWMTSHDVITLKWPCQNSVFHLKSTPITITRWRHVIGNFRWRHFVCLLRGYNFGVHFLRIAPAVQKL